MAYRVRNPLRIAGRWRVCWPLMGRHHGLNPPSMQQEVADPRIEFGRSAGSVGAPVANPARRAYQAVGCRLKCARLDVLSVCVPLFHQWEQAPRGHPSLCRVYPPSPSSRCAANTFSRKQVAKTLEYKLHHLMGDAADHHCWFRYGELPAKLTNTAPRLCPRCRIQGLGSCTLANHMTCQSMLRPRFSHWAGNVSR